MVLELAVRQLDGPSYLRVRQAEYYPFTWFIGAVFLLTLISSTTYAVQARRSPHFRTALVALALIFVAIGITLAVNGPINLEQQTWTAAAPPPDWAQIRDRWQIAHAARTAALILALACLGL
jgi:hypothetical protein